MTETAVSDVSGKAMDNYLAPSTTNHLEPFPWPRCQCGSTILCRKLSRSCWRQILLLLSIRRSHLVSMVFFDFLSCGFGDFVCGPKTKNYDLVILMFWGFWWLQILVIASSQFLSRRLLKELRLQNRGRHVGIVTDVVKDIFPNVAFHENRTGVMRSRASNSPRPPRSTDDEAAVVAPRSQKLC